MSSFTRRIQRKRNGLGTKLGVQNPNHPQPNSLPARGSRRRTKPCSRFWMMGTRKLREYAEKNATWFSAEEHVITANGLVTLQTREVGNV